MHQDHQQQNDEHRTRQAQPDDGVGPPNDISARSAELRAESGRLLEAADEGFARAESIDAILDDELSRDSPRFLTSIQQTSGQ